MTVCVSVVAALFAATAVASRKEVNALNKLGRSQAQEKNYDAAAQTYLKARRIDGEKYHPWASLYFTTVVDMNKDKSYTNAATMAAAFLDGGSKDQKAIARAAGLWGEAIVKSRPPEEARTLIAARLKKGDGVCELLTAFYATWPTRAGNVARFAETFKLYDRYAAKATREEKVKFWDDFARKAWGSCACPAMKRAMSELAALGEDVENGYHRRKILRSIEAFESLKSFPKSESEIAFPDSVADFGVTIEKTVHVAKDFGFDPVNATEHLQKAIDSGATRIIVENVGKPWYIRKIRIVRDDLELVFKKGVKIHTDRTWENFAEGQMFVVKGKNIVIKGENPNDTDVVVSQFYDLADRRKNCRTYGKSAFTLLDCENVCIKNLRASDTAEDGLCLAGLGLSNKNVYIENVDFASNFRQGCSICAGHGVYFKNVKFRETTGGSPLSGVDLEPAELNQANSDIYFFDCTFDANAGSGLIMSTSSVFPITLFAKRCVFKNQRANLLDVAIRTGIYNENGIKTPGKAVFEDCEFLGRPDRSPIRVTGVVLIDTLFRNCRITDGGDEKQTGDASPFLFVLNRDWDNSTAGAKRPQATIAFDNVTVKGFKDAPLVTFNDKAGRYSVNPLKGTVTFNGKKIDMSSFSHLAPEKGLTDLPDAVPTDFAPSAAPAAIGRNEMKLRFGYDSNWWQPWPDYNYVFYGEKGKKAVFEMRLTREPRENERAIRMTAPSGKTLTLGEFVKGDNVVKIAFTETGWYAFHPPRKHEMIAVEGVHLAYYTAAAGDKRCQIIPKGGAYQGYFEMPAKSEATFKVCRGVMEFRDRNGVRQGVCAEDPRTGNAYITLKSKSRKNEIWSFVIARGTTFEMFQPLSGVWADSPEAVPCRVKNDKIRDVKRKLKK